MKKSLLAMAMAAMLGLFAQIGTAKAFLLQDRSPNVTAGQIIAGGGMTAAYFSLTCRHGFSHCARFDSATFAQVVWPDHSRLFRAQPDHRWRSRQPE